MIDINFLETNANSELSSETDDYKLQHNNLVLQSTIDPSDWRHEVDRVQNLLEIQEYPEFLMSASESSNINSMYLQINEKDTIRKIKNISSFFESIKNKYHIQNFLDVQKVIDDQLKKVSIFEKSLSSSYKIKKKVIIIF
jgi:hypothetical protein